MSGSSKQVPTLGLSRRETKILLRQKVASPRTLGAMPGTVLVQRTRRPAARVKEAPARGTGDLLTIKLGHFRQR